MFKFSKRSLNRLATVDEKLQAVTKRALEISEVDFSVLEGKRSLATQKRYFHQGKSRTMKSKHLTGRAVDLAPYPIDWNDLDRFRKVAEAMKKASEELDIAIVWGGDWKTFIDMPHFELSD